VALLSTVALLLLIAWTTDSSRNRWIAAPAAGFFAVAALWKARQFHEYGQSGPRDTMNPRGVQ
jgi:hypothetical protein